MDPAFFGFAVSVLFVPTFSFPRVIPPPVVPPYVVLTHPLFLSLPFSTSFHLPCILHTSRAHIPTTAPNSVSFTSSLPLPIYHSPAAARYNPPCRLGEHVFPRCGGFFCLCRVSHSPELLGSMHQGGGGALSVALYDFSAFGIDRFHPYRSCVFLSL